MVALLGIYSTNLIRYLLNGQHSKICSSYTAVINWRNLLASFDLHLSVVVPLVLA